MSRALSIFARLLGLFVLLIGIVVPTPALAARGSPVLQSDTEIFSFPIKADQWGSPSRPSQSGRGKFTPDRTHRNSGSQC